MMDKLVHEEQFRNGNALCAKITTKTFRHNRDTIERVDYILKYTDLFGTTVNREKLIELQNVISEALNAQ